MTSKSNTNNDDLDLSDSFADFPSFFTNGVVDDQKYESLLDDLRAHDLLGPVESKGDSNSGASSLFFNDAFSAVFMGNYNQSTPSTSTGKSPSRPPPGFIKAPPGFPATSETDLKWARGQQSFSSIEEKYHRLPETTNAETDSVVDESQIPSLHMLLDDEEVQGNTPPKPIMTEKSDNSVAEPLVDPPLPVAPPPPMPPQFNNIPLPPGAPYPPPPPFGHGPPIPQQGAPGVPHFQPPGIPHPGPFMGPQTIPPPPMHLGPHGPIPMANSPYSPPVQQPNYKIMTSRDINFVVQQQLKQVRSSDPYSDDYYYHNFTQKALRIMNKSAGSSRGQPLPSWKLKHVQAVDPQEKTREKSRKWETHFQVLGRQTKGSLYRPRQQLNLSVKGESADIGNAKNDESKDGESSTTKDPASKTSSAVFGNAVWQKRHQIHQGMVCLLSLQDARHLLDARGINVQQFHSMKDVDPTLAELRTHTASLLVELAAIVGVVVDSPPGKEAEASSLQCDLSQLHTILSMSKGKTLVSRALPLLHPSARFVLLPHVLEYVLGSEQNSKSHGDQDSGDNDDDTGLCQAVVLMLLYHPPSPAPSLLAECLERALEGHNILSLSRVLHHRARAEALQALLQSGANAMSQTEDEAIVSKWNHSQSIFVELATTIKNSS